jgi:hypothetical protein
MIALYLLGVLVAHLFGRPRQPAVRDAAPGAGTGA